MSGISSTWDVFTGLPIQDQDGDVTPIIAIGVSGNTYTSPNFHYTVTWDAEKWRVVYADGTETGETLALVSKEGRSLLSLDALTAFAGDKSAHLQAQVVSVNQAPRDHYNVHMVKESLVGRDRAAAIYRLEAISLDLTRDHVIDDFECRTITPGQSTLGVVHAVSPWNYGRQLVLAAAVLATIRMPRG